MIYHTYVPLFVVLLLKNEDIATKGCCQGNYLGEKIGLNNNYFSLCTSLAGWELKADEVFR